MRYFNNKNRTLSSSTFWDDKVKKKNDEKLFSFPHRAKDGV